MKKCIGTFILLFSGIYCNAQPIEIAVDEYFKAINKSPNLSLQHGPVKARIDLHGKGSIFFVKKLDVENNTFQSIGILFDEYRSSYTTFGHYDFGHTYGIGVTSVFFEDLDGDNNNEIIVLYEFGGRTYFSPKGGYAGIKNQYKTRVYKYHNEGGINHISEYKIMGDLLTVNLPIHTGTMDEEFIIGREDDLSTLRNILGVTYNATQVKKQISLLKENGFLRGTRNKH